MNDLGTKFFDSIALERAATFNELQWLQRTVEARMKAERASDEDWRIWQAELAVHARRVARAVVA